MQQGSGLARNNGDFVSNQTTGLNSAYSYFIEVPPLTPNLTVDLFDSDLGRGADESASTGAPGNRDRAFSGAYNSSVTYRLINPTGTTVQTLTRNNTNGTDNGWEQLASISSPANGHWTLQIDMSNTVTTGDDVNGVGIRGHDGTAGTGGVELNIYTDTYMILGTHALAGDIAILYYKYPYVTSGCDCYFRDFDADDADTFTNSWVDLQSRNGEFNPTAVTFLSTQDIWNTRTFTGFADDGAPGDGLLSDGYGIWPSQYRTDGVTQTGSNYISYYVASFNAPGAPFTGGGISFAPNSQPEENTFRIYLPQDGSTVSTPIAPVRPFLRQYVYDTLSGPNPIINGQTTTVRLRVEMVNPTPYAITFSASNLVTVNSPATRVQYVNPSTTVSQGSIVSQPANNGNGNITWNPGTLAAGATAQLEYQIRVTPTADNQTTTITGTPALNGTTARFVDMTGNTVQARATYTFGPICQLSLVSGLSDSLSVDLLGFNSEVLPNGSVRLVWNTMDEVENAGFEVFSAKRSGDIFLEDELLTSTPIPSLGSEGGTYEWSDPTPLGLDVERGYYLVDIDFSGKRTMHGPIFVNNFIVNLDSKLSSWEVYK